jgi:hypothetical protein
VLKVSFLFYNQMVEWSFTPAETKTRIEMPGFNASKPIPADFLSFHAEASVTLNLSQGQWRRRRKMIF